MRRAAKNRSRSSTKKSKQSDTEGTEGMQMSQKPIRTYKELLFPPHSDPVNEQPNHGEINKQRMPARILLRPRFLELNNIIRCWN